jgi:hypothetical protein
MALIWQPNSAAKLSISIGHVPKADLYKNRHGVRRQFWRQNLLRIPHIPMRSAVDGGTRSAKTGRFHKDRGQTPGCDPYFRDNITLSAEGRAFTIDTISTWAVTVGVQPHYLGDYSYDVFSQLTKDDNVPWPSYDDRYCP